MDTSSISSIITTTLQSVSEWQHIFLWALIVAFVLAFVLGFGMGANDVANAFGTSVGSKVLGLKTAFFLATIMETLGAVLVGFSVTDTMRKQVVNIDIYEDNPAELLVGQIAILGGGAAWLMIATMLKLPVSTTHSIVGSTLGFTLVMRGLDGIQWGKVGEIAASWVISPVFSGTLSAVLYMIVDFAVLRRRNPVKCGLRALPIFYFVCVAFNTFVVVYGGSKYLGLDKIQLGYAFLISVAMGTFGALLFILVSRTCLMTWINRADTSPPVSITSDGAVVIGDNLSASNEAYVVTPTKSHPPEVPASKDYGVDEPRWTPKGFIKWFFPSRTRQEDPKTLRLFSSIQVFTACFAGYAHGANDVSNAIAPLAAAVSIYQNRSVAQFEQTPIWVLLFGVTAICVGLWILGSRVIKTVGQKMSEINPASGFTIEFGAAVAALVASKIGLPISTTHCLVGSVVFVGTVKSGEGIDWKIFGNIALSWIVTLPISCAISAGIMAILKLVVF